MSGTDDGPGTPTAFDAWPPDRPTGLVAASYLATLAAGFAVAGPRGALAGLGTAVTGVVAGPLLAFAAGHALFLAAAPGYTLLQLAVLEAALGACLVAATREPTAGAGRPHHVAGAALVLAALTAATYHATASLPTTAVVLLGTSGAAAYLLHRYERLALGIVREAAE